MSMDLIKLGKSLKEKRLELNMSLRDAANLIGISHNYLSILEKAKDPRSNSPIKPTIDTLKLISDSYNLDINSLLPLAGYGDIFIQHENPIVENETLDNRIKSMSLGKTLRVLREEREKKQVDVAKDLKITTQAYSQYERDVRIPDADMTNKLADYYNVSTDFLYGRTDKRDKGSSNIVLGIRLKELRSEKNLTQEELASQLNIARSTIAGYETKRKEPDYETLNMLADFFNVSTDYLLGRVDKKNMYRVDEDRLPPDLQGIGLNYIHIARKIEEEGLSPEEIEILLDTVKKLRASKQERNK